MLIRVSWLAVSGRKGFALSTLPTRFQRNPAYRRSQRVQLAVKVLVTGVRSDGRPFFEETCTSVVNANGALMRLAQKVSLGQLLTIRNLLSNQELPCAVLDLATSQDGISEVAFEFLQPDPRFWRISFPPPDWSPRSPEAKRLALAPIPFSQFPFRK